jgi:hypothetical protein
MLAILGRQLTGKSTTYLVFVSYCTTLAFLISHRRRYDNYGNIGLADLALGFIFVGSKHGEVSEIILQTVMEKYQRGDKSLDGNLKKFMALGLGLLYLGEVSVCNNCVRLLTTLQDFRMLLMRPSRL